MNKFLFLRRLSLVTLAAGALGLAPLAPAQAAEDPIQVARSVVEADRHTVVTEALHLTGAEATAFWPLYQQYRAAMDQHGNSLAKLVIEYADLYPDVPETRAQQMLKEITGLERKLVDTRATYLKKIGKVLASTKTLRFAQVENRLDLALRLQLAAHIPLVPLEGRLTGQATAAAAYAPGVPGGVVVQTVELAATVAAVDKAKRKVTLVSADGIKQTVKAGPDVINFDQIRVGDQLKVTATQELVVQMATPGESTDNGAAALVALAPKGAKPGGLMAETTQVTATVTAIDAERRLATLECADGSTRIVAVRQDVDLKKRQVGDKVVIRTTESLAISVKKP